MKQDTTEASGLFGELATALLPASLDYIPAASSSHTCTETATALSLSLRRLIGPLHKIILLYVTKRATLGVLLVSVK